MGKIGASAAISQAETEFNAWYNTISAQLNAFNAGGPWNIGVKNCGTDDFVTPDIEAGVVNTWRGKADMHGFERRGSMSSGESKIDLKFAWPGRNEASFNFHVWVKPDPAVEEARKKQSAADKKVAEEFKAKKEKEDKAKAEAASKAEAAAKVEAARQKKVQDAANKAWNDLGKKGQAGKTEKTWKDEWKKKNDNRFK